MHQQPPADGPLHTNSKTCNEQDVGRGLPEATEAREMAGPPKVHTSDGGCGRARQPLICELTVRVLASHAWGGIRQASKSMCLSRNQCKRMLGVCTFSADACSFLMGFCARSSQPSG